MTTLNKQESSGLSSKLKARQNAVQNNDINEKTYTFTINAEIQDKIEIPKTQITIPNDMKLSEASKIALTKIKLKLEVIGVQVSEQIEHYKPRLAKKNGKAKTDMPCLDYDQILYQIKINTVCLDPKQQSAVSLIQIKNKQSKQIKSPLQKPIQPSIVKEIEISKKKEEPINVQNQNNCMCLLF